MLQIKKGKQVYELEYFIDSDDWEIKNPKGLYEVYTDESLLAFFKELEKDEIETPIANVKEQVVLTKQEEKRRAMLQAIKDMKAMDAGT